MGQREATPDTTDQRVAGLLRLTSRYWQHDDEAALIRVLVEHGGSLHGLLLSRLNVPQNRMVRQS